MLDILRITRDLIHCSLPNIRCGLEAAPQFESALYVPSGFFTGAVGSEEYTKLSGEAVPIP